MLRFMLLLIICFPTKSSRLKTYIVHLNSPPPAAAAHRPRDLEEWYSSFLPKHKSKLVYAYHHAITGFAAQLSPQEANRIKNMSHVISVTPQTLFRLHTTRSPTFLGLHHTWKQQHSNYGEGTIIGVLDSGITPGHPSFNDKGVPPPPQTWKGKCQVARWCNNKLIGIRNFVAKTSPLDQLGHGTHTSSTAAGNFVGNANIFGNANGTASGMAPFAHLAIYKVCHKVSCSESDIIAAMDAAIGDGVHILSLSLGGSSAPFYRDTLAISAFSAIQKGIFVTCSAGNSGPFKSRLSNESPWILTVGASSIDRKIRTTVYLGNNKLLDGESLYQPKNFRQNIFRPIVYPGQKGDYTAATCDTGSLDNVDVKGKVVLCDLGGLIGTTEKGKVVKDAGGAAMILANSVHCPEATVPEAHVLPASNIGYKEGVEVKRYLSSSSYRVATILLRGTVLGVESAPEVACFSSRGPSRASPGILKPDIIGPGVDILAAWPSSVKNKARFTLLSGTSMSCPHLAGIAAVLHSAHPEWSPAAIKSAIMTTASQVSLNGKSILDEREAPANMFAIGAGHVNPSKANDPGLVFDIQPDDYIPYLCGLGYTSNQIRTIVRRSSNSRGGLCIKSIPEAELNYPSIVVTLKRGETKTYSRTVTNVGMANSRYMLGNVSVPRGVRVMVSVDSPFQGQGQVEGLIFIAMQQKKTYKVTFSRNNITRSTYGQGYMSWVSGRYVVRIPFLFKFD